MSIDTNQFVNNLKIVLSQFELPEEKLKNESFRLERFQKTLSKSKVRIDEETLERGVKLYTHGLNVYHNSLTPSVVN